MTTTEILPLLRIYDLRDPDSWQQTHRHRGWWGKRFTSVYDLDENHIILVFRSGGERWSAWERVRLNWSLEDGAAA